MADLSFLARLGLDVAVGVPILTSEDGKHRQSLAAPGAGGTRWRSRMKSTLKKLLRSECIMTQDVDRLARFMTTYINVQYVDERVPNIDMKSMVQEAVEEFRGDKKEKKGSVR